MIARHADKLSIAGKKNCHKDSEILTKSAKNAAGIPFDHTNHDNNFKETKNRPL
jgi:hypothetical protein